MKKAIVFLLMVSATLIFAACGNSSNEGSAPAATPAPTPSATVEPKVEEPAAATETDADAALNPDGVFDVVLVDAGESALEVLKVVRNEGGFDLAAAKDLVDNVPSTIASQLTLSEAEALKEKVAAEGATLQLVETEKVATTGIKVVLTDKGIAALNVVKEIKNITELGLAESKELVDNIPSVIAENITMEEAESIKAILEEVGATVEIQQ